MREERACQATDRGRTNVRLSQSAIATTARNGGFALTRSAGNISRNDRVARESVSFPSVTIDEADRSCVADLICRFQRAFDTHDWDDLESCLMPRLQVDYSDLRNISPEQESASGYCEQRKDALDHLDLQHNHTNLVVIGTVQPGRFQAQCNFQIYRFERSGSRHFHTYGTYLFGLERDPKNDLRISAIQQRVTRSSGDPEIHRGVDPKERG
jgi:hypothetical protein